MIKTWRRGYLLDTMRTRRLTPGSRELYNKTEQRVVYTDFTEEDEGRSRKHVAVLNENHPDYEFNMRLIENAPELLEAARDYVEGTGGWEVFQRLEAVVNKITEK